MGTLSWLLLLLSVNGVALALLLAVQQRNVIANRFLAALIAAISLRLLIYVLGFAGAYDRHPWLTFAPFDASLAFGPLLWLYVATLTHGRPPARWMLHLAPAAVQIAYSAAAFALPTQAKLRWYRGPHLELVEPVALGLLLLSCAIYLHLAWRRQRDYQRWLDGRFGNREQWRLTWLAIVIAAFAATLALAVAASLIDTLVAPLDYFGRVPVVFASSLLAYVLGLIGWRQAGLALPAQPESPEAEEPPGPSSGAAARFAEWTRRVEAGEWWRDEQATLASIANRLGVSERSLSRGLRDGGGCNFNTFINGFRVEAVKRALASGSARDLLTIALDNGFNSKASFNRVFRQHTGVSPSQWRDAAQMPPKRPSIAI